MSQVAVSKPAAGTRRLARTHDLAHPALAVGVFLATAGLASANGGFFPSSWGWSTLGLVWLAIVALIVGPVQRPTRLELRFAAVAVLIAAWTWVSIAWSSDRTQSVLEGERTLVLVAAVAAVYCFAGRRSVRLLVGSVFAGIVAVTAWALLTRLFPDRIGTYDALAVYRLAEPVGYWNGLGILAAMGSLLALGIATRAERTWARVAAAASLVILVPTLYFTFGRGSWIALGVGIAVLVALDPQRLRTITAGLVYAAAPALAVVIASRSHALTHPHSALARAAHDGHRLALVMVGLVAVQCLVAVVLRRVQERRVVPRAVRMGWASALVVALVVGLVVTFVHYGSPIAVAQRGAHSFTAPPPAPGTDLNQRLFNLSGNGRWLLWQAAWRQSRSHPLLGSGAGSFEQYWTQHRPTTLAGPGRPQPLPRDALRARADRPRTASSPSSRSRSSRRYGPGAIPSYRRLRPRSPPSPSMQRRTGTGSSPGSRSPRSCSAPRACSPAASWATRARNESAVERGASPSRRCSASPESHSSACSATPPPA